MLCETLLDEYPALRTGDPRELAGWMKRNFGVTGLRMGELIDASGSLVNRCTLPSISLTYLRFGGQVHGESLQDDTFQQEFPLSGTIELTTGGDTTDAGAAPGDTVSRAPTSRCTFTCSEDYASLSLKITPAAVTQRLSMLIDHPVNPPLELTGPGDPGRVAAYRRLARFFAQELDALGGQPIGPVTAELEDAAIVSFLFANSHNYSHMLERAPRAAAPWQVRRAVDYMEQFWDQPITIEQLTRVSEASARSLFLLFKKSYGISPMVYLSQVRLRHAHELLSKPEPGINVTKVGFMCGFSNMGNFALKYYGAFGEKPSDTLRLHRR